MMRSIGSWACGVDCRACRVRLSQLTTGSRLSRGFGSFDPRSVGGHNPSFRVFGAPTVGSWQSAAGQTANLLRQMPPTGLRASRPGKCKRAWRCRTAVSGNKRFTWNRSESTARLSPSCAERLRGCCPLVQRTTQTLRRRRSFESFTVRRPCRAFTPWRGEGGTARENLEMLDRERRDKTNGKWSSVPEPWSSVL